MVNYNKNEVEVVNGEKANYLIFKKLRKQGIVHAYALKKDDLDFSFGRPNHDLSYDMLFEELGIERDTLVEPVQKHTDVIRCIDRVIDTSELDEVDGLLTNRENITLSSKNADCILLLFYDPVKKVIGDVHSGWKGTFKKIALKTVQKMIDAYKCDPSDIQVYICPSIRKDHFEVDEDIKELCEGIFNYFNLEDIIFKGDIVDGKQKYYIDLVQITKKLLLESKVLEKNIIDSEICSVCEQEEVHSARAEGENFKRGTAIIKL